ncbi:MAG: LiaF domain-containing protein [Anaerolineaceae bacterium]
MEQRRNFSILGPLLLVGVGVILLLNNLGMASISIWEVLLRLWPILLVGAGLDILIGRRSLIGSILVTLLVIGMFVGGIWWMNSSTGQIVPSQAFSEPLKNATSAEISVDFPVGELTITGGAQTAQLLEANAAVPKNENILKSTTMDGSRAVTDISTRGDFQVSTSGSLRNRRLDLKLNPTLPIALTADMGVGETVIDLTKIQATELNVNNGVGTITLTLPEKGNMEITMDNGVGEMIIYVPEGAAVQIVTEDRLGGTQVSADLTRENSTYTSSNYETSANRIRVITSGGIGSLRILPAP